ncbi:TPA: hypothetical protein ACK3JR_002021 [Mannheimia haemolytica]
MWIVDLIPWIIIAGATFIVLETLLPLFASIIGVLLSPFVLFARLVKNIQENKNKSWLYTQSKLLGVIHLFLISLFCFALHFHIADKLIILFLSIVMTLITSYVIYSLKPNWFKTN